jgi:hypothetical protein
MVIFRALPIVPLTICWLLKKPFTSFREAFPDIVLASAKL